MTSAEKLRKIWVVLVYVIVALPFLLMTVTQIQHFSREQNLYPSSDRAILEIGTIQASRGLQLLGPYSRFRWNHPGPAYFYTMLPFYLLSGGMQSGLSIGAIFINLSAIIAILTVSLRIGGRSFFSVVSLFMTLYICFFGTRISSIWNPNVTILPFAAFLFLCAAVAVGRIRYLPFAVALLSFVIQTHISYAPTIVLVLITAVSIYLLRRFAGKARPERHRTYLWVIISLAVFITMWLPAFVEELINNQGNLSRIVAFFSQERDTHSLAETVSAVAPALARLPVYYVASQFNPLFGREFIASPLLVFPVQTLLLLTAVYAGFKRRKFYLVALGIICAVATATALISATRITGPINTYLLEWISVIGLISIAIAFTGLLFLLNIVSRLKASRKLLVFTTITSFAVMALVIAWKSEAFQKPYWEITQHKEVKRISAALKKYLAGLDGIKPELRFISADWGIGAGVILQLYKDKIELSVSDRYTFMFGKEFATKGKAEIEIWFCDPAMQRAIAQSKAHQLLAAERGLLVYSYDTSYVSRKLYKGKVIVRTRGTVGKKKVVVDGEFPPTSAHWNSPKCLALIDERSWITLKIPRGKLEGIIVSASTNDSYAVLYSTDGENFVEIGTIPALRGVRMFSRMFFSDKLEEARFVRISPKSGDGKYSIGEIGLFLVKKSDQ